MFRLAGFLLALLTSCAAQSVDNEERGCDLLKDFKTHNDERAIVKGWIEPRLPEINIIGCPIPLSVPIVSGTRDTANIRSFHTATARAFVESKVVYGSFSVEIEYSGLSPDPIYDGFHSAKTGVIILDVTNIKIDAKPT